MAKFSGFKCDSCGNVFDADSRIRKVVTYHRSENGSTDSYEQDLCKQCAPSPEEAAGTMRVVPKRHRKAQTD